MQVFWEQRKGCVLWWRKESDTMDGRWIPSYRQVCLIFCRLRLIKLACWRWNHVSFLVVVIVSGGKLLSLFQNCHLLTYPQRVLEIKLWNIFSWNLKSKTIRTFEVHNICQYMESRVWDLVRNTFLFPTAAKNFGALLAEVRNWTGKFIFVSIRMGKVMHVSSLIYKIKR